MRFVLANLCVFVVYTAVGILGTWLDVRYGQPDESMLFVMFGVFQWTSLPVAVAVNSMLMHSSSWSHRILYGTLVGVALFALAVIPYSLIVIGFHIEIGGTL